MKNCLINIPDRPAFMKIVENRQQDYGGYILQLDIDNLSASIINFKKGGNKTMAVKTVVRVKDGFEDVYALLLDKKDKVEEDVKKLVQERLDKIETMISDCTYTEEVEVPDEEVVEEETTNVVE